MPFSNKKTFFEGIRDESVRHEIVSENIIEGLAFQIAALRKARGWTEQDLAGRCGVHQKVIEKWEDPNQSKRTFAPFLRLAQAFDVSFTSRFEAFGEMADWFINLSSKKVAPPSYEEEQIIALQGDAVGSDALEGKSPLSGLTVASSAAQLHSEISLNGVSADMSGAWDSGDVARMKKKYEANILYDMDRVA